MDVFERLNRKFGTWYEGLFGGAPDTDLRPRDILRRILATMEDGRREGLNGQIYVPNRYTLQLAVRDEDERNYLRTFLDADELAAAVLRYMEQHGYQTRGGLTFQIEETDASAGETGDRVRVRCRFDASAPARPAPVTPPEDVDDHPHAAPPVAPRPLADFAPAHPTTHAAASDGDEEPGTVPAVALASLTVAAPDGQPEVYPLTTRGVQFGRGRQAGNDIVLGADALVSKRHGRIAYADGGFVVSDLGSTNGTFVNGNPIEQPCPLRDGDEVRAGGTVLRFRAGKARVPMPAVAPAAASAPARPSAVGGFRLVSDRGEVYPLASEMEVGRALTSDLVLIGEGVANRHARLSIRDDQVFVEDLASAAGTFVHRERIPPHFPVALYENDEIAFGQLTLHLERGGRRPG